MKTIFLGLMLMALPLLANATQAKPTHKGVIESFDLETQTISFAGQVYAFAQQVTVVDKQEALVGFRALIPGQLVEFTVDNNSDVRSSRTDKDNSQKITYIKILSDNTLSDKVH